MKEVNKKAKVTELKTKIGKQAKGVEVDTNKKRSIYSYTKYGRSKWVILPLALLVVLSIVGYLGYKNLVLAWVDKTPITKFNLYSQLEKKYGKDFTERLISETLILNEAKAKGVEANDNDVNAQIKKIEEQQGGADKLSQALQAQNMTMDELRSQIKFRVLIDKMFGKDITITDKEIDEYIEKNKDQIPPIEDKNSSESAALRQNLSDSLKGQKANQLFNDWLTKSLQSSRIKRL